MTGWLGADRRGVLVPQFSTDDISPSPPLCIGCSDGWSTTQHALKKASPGRQQRRQQKQQQQIRAFTADATAAATVRLVTADVPPTICWAPFCEGVRV